MSRGRELAVKRFDGVDSLPPSYGTLFAQAERQSFFLSLDWFRNFERTVVDETRTVVVYGVEDPGDEGSRALGALVTWRYRRSERPLSPRRLESLGNYYTSYFAPVIGEGLREVSEVCHALASGIRSDGREWDELYLQPLDASSPGFAALVGALGARGLVVQTFVCFGNWYLDVGGRSYAEYSRDLPSVVRKNLPYNARRLERSGKVRYELITGKDGLEEALEDYGRVYIGTWKQPEPHPAFVPGLARAAAARGWLRLGLVYLDGEPVAAQLWLVSNGVASIYKMCYDQKFAKYSAGTVLTGRLLEHVIDVDRVREVDYLSGDDAYKQHWMSHRRERWGIRAFNPFSARGLVQAAKYVGGRSGKRALRVIRRLGERLPALRSARPTNA